MICAAAPWTSTTRMFSERSTATSSRMLAKFSSVTIAPSTLEDERLLAELRDVLQDAAQVGQFHDCGMRAAYGACDFIFSRSRRL